MKALLLLLSITTFAADLGPDLLAAAKKGQTDRVEALATQGVSLESKDRDGRTALMLAAQHGHPDTVRALLAKGAKPDARDKQGWTAYALAVFSSGGGRDEVMKALPAPPTVRLKLDAVLVPENLYSSCFMTPQQLAGQMKMLHVESRLVAAIRDVAASSKAPVDLVAGDSDATLTLRVRPRAVCVQQQTSDKMSLEVDARVVEAGAAIFEKMFGGGLKSQQIVTSQAQYEPVFDGWAKKQAGPIYWDAVEALMRHPR
ncbi:MAG TPA: ankyrin repeat domain-containing protein [Bryobacteraceae bacterium]|jgi:hypothetical protein